MDAPTDQQLLHRLRGGLVELAVLVGVYAAYSLTRLAADDSFAPARERADQLLRAEGLLGLDLKHRLNDWFATVPSVGMAGSYFYATTHYVVTAAVLVWLWRRGPSAYRPGRRALVAATGNHWVVDALAGWAVVWAAIAVTARHPAAVPDVPVLVPRERELVHRIAA